MQVKRMRDDDEDTASSTSDQNDQNLKSAKDRTCPFCHQAFTSSSLGRHLDLYIRPNKPKDPDGIHKVDEIRKIRGGITRRTKGKKQRSEDIKRADTNGSDVPDVEEEKRNGSTIRSLVNSADWRATGVINDTTVRQSFLSDGKETESPGVVEQKSKLPTAAWRDGPSQQEIEENGRAAELALRELSASISAARKAQNELSPFDNVDVFALSFPALCLTLLPPPNALYSSTPFSDEDSWSIEPPDERQFAALQKWTDRRRTQRDAIFARFDKHLKAAFSHWSRLDEAAQATTWRLETLRAFRTSQTTTSSLREELKTAKQRVAHLESEYELLSNCQLPREKMLRPPKTTSIPQALLNTADEDMDPDEMIAHWRSAVRTVTKPKKKPEPHYGASVVSGEGHREAGSGTGYLTDDMVMYGAVHGVEGPMDRNDDSAMRMEKRVIPYTVPKQNG